MSALPHFSDVDLLRYGKRIIDLNSEITDCTLDFCVAEQELKCFMLRGGLAPGRRAPSPRAPRCGLNRDPFNNGYGQDRPDDAGEP
jgi:hypothetical protein